MYKRKSCTILRGIRFVMADAVRNEEVVYDRWVWLDLEMTGLNEASCVILQVAMVITDPQLRILAEIDMTIWQPESALSAMIPVVRSMHTKNGLLDRVRTSEYSLEQAEAELLTLLTRHVNYRQGVLAGNTIYVDGVFYGVTCQLLRAFFITVKSMCHRLNS